jgi:predicted small lipoprotein YifL
MEKGVRMRNFALILLLCFAMAGCGVDGPPKAPSQNVLK